MARVKVKAARLGQFRSPEGPVTITPERVRHWAATHRELAAAGVKIPVPWGHHLAALPANPDDPEDVDTVAFHRSRFNAGYCSMLAQDEVGELEAWLDAPGLEEHDGHLVSVATLPDGTPVKTAIGEVSLSIGDWKDGKGKVWRDIVGHLALVPLPVIPGQGGFQSLSTRGRFTCLSTGGIAPGADGTTDVPVAVTISEPAEPPTVTPTDPPPAATLATAAPAKSKAGADDVADLAADLTAPPDEELADDPSDARDPMADVVSRLKETLAKLGVVLPDSSGKDDPLQLLEHLDVALGALAGRMDAERAAAEQRKAAATPPARPTAEESPGGMAMLATLEATNPVAFRIVTQGGERHRAKCATKLDGFIGRGVQKVEVDKLRARLTGQQLSLDGEGRPTLGETARVIALLDRILPKPGDPRAFVGPDPKRTATLATPLPSPAESPGGEATPRYDYGLRGLPMTDAQYAEQVAKARGHAAPPPAATATH